MDRRMLTIILALILIASFFLPLYSGGGGGSALDIVKSSYPVSGFEPILMKYLWILIPLSGLMLLIGALNNGNYFFGRGIWTVLPLLAVLYLTIRPITKGLDAGEYIKHFGVGMWMMIVGSLVLAFYNPRR
jgi:hypothetical protein